MRASRSVFALAVGAVTAVAGANAQVVVSAEAGGGAASASVVVAYWTLERLESAQPMPTPTRLVDLSKARVAARVAAGPPGAAAAHPPGRLDAVEQRLDFNAGNSWNGQAAGAPMALGTAPIEPLNGPYGPFQRWTMEGNYLPFPRAIHGKLFFSLGVNNYVCSASVIGRSTIATAGHCVSDGAGSWGSNYLFCPSYYQGGVYPTRGCWAATSLTTSGAWFFSGDPDYDYACIVAATAGTVVADKIGNVTGWAGRAWNWVDAPEITFGYPADPPFAGNIIQMTASVDWYGWDASAGGQVSKIIGSDLTGGASGGGWFLGWRAPGAEVADSDGSWATDPLTAGPYLNGVNSHKRCVVTCQEPPSLNNGVFWQEMSSPPFLNTVAADGDSEEIFAVCLAHANNS